MVNSSDFAERIKKILDHYRLTASTFAEKIGVQRSSISHILSGRNKPSLDFVLKVSTEFPDVDIYWLLNGRGTFPKAITQNIVKNPTLPQTDEQVSKPPPAGKRIIKIVVFYEDGTFEEFNK